MLEIELPTLRSVDDPLLPLSHKWTSMQQQEPRLYSSCVFISYGNNNLHKILFMFRKCGNKILNTL